MDSIVTMATRWRTPVALGTAATVCALMLRPAALPLSSALLGLLAVWIGVAPGLAFLRTSSDARPFCPLFALTNLFYAVFFGMPVFLIAGITRNGQINFGGDVSIDAISHEAQILVVAGLGLLWVGYFGGRRLLSAHLPSFGFPGAAYARSDGFAARVQLLTWALAIAHLAYLLFPRLQAMASVNQGLKPMGLVAFAVFYALWRTARLPHWQAALAFILWMPVVMILYLRTGSLYEIVLVGVAYAVLRTAFAKRFPWFFLSALAVAFAVAYPLGGSGFRQAVWDRKSELGIVGTIQAFARTFVDFYRPVIAANFGNGPPVATIDPTVYASVIRRISLIDLFSHVVEKSPGTVPYWKGETFKPLATALIPRALWSGKPRETAGNAFGVRYGLIPPENTWHSANLPWIVEMYANFGRWGVIVGMALVGFVFFALERFFVRPTLTPIEKACGTAIILRLFFQESNVSLMTGTLPALAIALWVYFAVGLIALDRVWPGARTFPR